MLIQILGTFLVVGTLVLLLGWTFLCFVMSVFARIQRRRGIIGSDQTIWETRWKKIDQEWLDDSGG